MKTFSQFLFVCFTTLLMSSVYAFNLASLHSPVGYWQTIDDVSGKPKSILQIWETPNKVLSARILKIYPRPGYDQNELCTACQGEKQNQRIVGMVIMNGLQQSRENPSEWANGEILDPKNGKTYHCKLELKEYGQKLSVRGYIGLPLFGRSQTWVRVSSPAG